MARKRKKHPTTAESKRTKKRLNLSAEEDQELIVGGNQDLPPQVDQEQVKEGKLGFLALPGELRNKIYGYVFADNWRVSNNRVNWEVKAAKSFKHPLALLQTCTQVYNEAADLPFTLSAFKIRLSSIQPKNKYTEGFDLVQTVIADNWIYGKVRLKTFFHLNSFMRLWSHAHKTYLSKMNCFFEQCPSVRHLVLICTCDYCKEADYNGVWDWEADHGVLSHLMHSTFPRDCSITIVWTKKTFKIENFREFLDAGLPASRA